MQGPVKTGPCYLDSGILFGTIQQECQLLGVLFEEQGNIGFDGIDPKALPIFRGHWLTGIFRVADIRLK